MHMSMHLLPLPQVLTGSTVPPCPVTLPLQPPTCCQAPRQVRSPAGRQAAAARHTCLARKHRWVATEALFNNPDGNHVLSGTLWQTI